MFREQSHHDVSWSRDFSSFCPFVKRKAWACVPRGRHSNLQPCIHTEKHIQKLLTLLPLINFALQSSLRTIRIPRRNDFPIKRDLGEDRLFISDSRSSLFQSFKLELIFQFSQWLLWTCSRGGQIEPRSKIFVPHKVTVASNALMCFARRCHRQQIFSSACWWRQSPSRVATSLTLQSTGLLPVDFYFCQNMIEFIFLISSEEAVTCGLLMYPDKQSGLFHQKGCCGHVCNLCTDLISRYKNI